MIKQSSRNHLYRLIYLAALLFLLLISSSKTTFAQRSLHEQYQELAERYSPVLYFHPQELFRPQAVDVMVNSSRLRYANPSWHHTNVLLNVTMTDLVTFSDKRYNLDAWIGDEGSSDYKNYTAHREIYQKLLGPKVGGYPPVTYAHVVSDEEMGIITIQYWLFYYYNDAFNKHEGDWEFVEVILSTEGEPEWVVLSQHHGGTRREWNSIMVEELTHPVVYVALGSHANYFWGNEVYPYGLDVGNTRIEIVDRTGSFDQTKPKVILIPDREEIESNIQVWAGLEWLLFQGRWGEVAPQADFSGPFGPADKGEQWERPYHWGIVQPLDTQIWYANRFRVEATGDAAQNIKFSLQDREGNQITAVDNGPNIALLHGDQYTKNGIIAQIKASPTNVLNLLVVWPNQERSTVTQYRFEKLSFQPSGQASIDISATNSPIVSIVGTDKKYSYTDMKEFTVTWDQKDVVWMVGFLPANEIVIGILISLILGILPTFVFIVGLTMCDTYEKEPKHLLAAAFLWGAIPSIAIALAVRLFFNVPLNLLGPELMEAVNAGIISPVIEEALKGIAVLIVAWRYWYEFDDIMDGVIYGAIAGFGFAMTSNILSYMGAFILHGFLGLSNTIFVEGLVFGLNQAMYTAIFGAGMGYARLAKNKLLRRLIPVLAFLLAVAVNGLHRIALLNSIGPDIITVLITWAGLAGVLLIMSSAMRRQTYFLKLDLVGEVPESVYNMMTRPWGRSLALFNAFRKKRWRGYHLTRDLQQLCGELALKKMQLTFHPDESKTTEIIQQLRIAIREIVKLLED